MAKISPKSAAGGGLLLIGLLAVGGGLLFFAGRSFRHGAAAETADGSPLAEIVQAGSGVGVKSLTMFGCDQTIMPKDQVAAWIAFYQTGRPLEVHARDEAGREWPIVTTSGKGHEICYLVPYGYDKTPQRLVAVVQDIQQKQSKEFPFPTLPPPRRYSLPHPYGEIPGLRVDADRGWITIKGDLPPGHLLLGKPLAGDLLGPVDAPYSQRVLSEGQKLSGGRLYPPIGPYAQTPQSMAFEFTEVNTVPHHTIVEFPPMDLVEQFGETWIRRGQSKVALGPEMALALQSGVQIPYRQPHHPQTAFSLLLRPRFREDVGGLRRYELIEPTSVAGLPLTVEPRLNGIVPVESPLTRTETGPAVGKLKVKVAVDYDTFVPVRKAVVIYRWPGLPLPGRSPAFGDRPIGPPPPLTLPAKR